ncbi:hypothetical protein TrRE_jg8085, partial [Triparma retinervis]
MDSSNVHVKDANSPTNHSALPPTPTTLPVPQYKHPTDTFIADLEFFQSLASPSYLHHLCSTQASDLSTRPFQLYLLYLYATFTKPIYARYVKFPVAFEHC